MIILISGGCKNGKTTIAEKISSNISKNNTKYYVATMIPYDDEDRLRINRHVEERKGLNFKTIEVKKSLDGLTSLTGTLLFDSLTAFVLNHIIDKNENYDILDIEKVIKCEIDKILDNNDKNIIFVSDTINCDYLKIINNYSDKYIHILSDIEKYISKYADVAMEVSFSNIYYYKGKEYEKELFNTI